MENTPKFSCCSTDNEQFVVEIFIIAALLHDVANGPFGHSYEYIMEKKGFIPEQGLEAVFTDVVSVGVDAHKNSSPFLHNLTSRRR